MTESKYEILKQLLRTNFTFFDNDRESVKSYTQQNFFGVFLWSGTLITDDCLGLATTATTAIGQVKLDPAIVVGVLGKAVNLCNESS